MSECGQSVIPNTDNSSEGCEFLIPAECVVDGDRTQEQINSDLLAQINELRQVIMSITYSPNSNP